MLKGDGALGMGAQLDFTCLACKLVRFLVSSDLLLGGVHCLLVIASGSPPNTFSNPLLPAFLTSCRVGRCCLPHGGVHTLMTGWLIVVAVAEHGRLPILVQVDSVVIGCVQGLSVVRQTMSWELRALW